ncbi:MAG: aminomethyltransferase family protein [Rhodospirillaceae bacterium]|nr:aminomethyltransferase family protein [Rhodospirillaceae bacterium]
MLIDRRVPVLPRGVERYIVGGGGAAVLAIAGGDRISVIDREGRQPCEVIVADAQGRVDPGLIGGKAGGRADGLRDILAAGTEDARKVVAGLRRRNLDLGQGPGQGGAIRLFGGDSPAGAQADFTAQSDGILVVAAPGAAMAPDGQDTATEIEVRIARAAPLSGQSARLPEPLADAVLDFEVPKASARAYEVKEGEYIQIIDSFGRQCSDFHCFNARALQKGIERDLDNTVTRTLSGRGYPGPGLFAKVFDQDFQPLVELVQDTCGRHDNFALACTAKYYEDMGYPGHVNCSDNFSEALAPYGIERRRGWAALNLFYNTGIDHNNVLYLDEPWSRPGDFVLFRALTDLVCVSSACPDDIDAANGWDPTPVHIRTYPKQERFSRAVAYRMTPDSEPKMTKETAFHPRLSALTRNYAEYRGYWLPNRFNNEGPVAEYWACREKAVMLDLSPLRKFEVTGPDAETLLQRALTRDVRKLSEGQVVYSAMCYETGGMLDDGTLFRLGKDNFRWIGGDDYGGQWLRELAEKQGLRAWVRSSTDQLHNLSVQGPKSREILRQVIWTPPAHTSVDELGWFRFTIGRLGDFNGPPVILSRTGYTGELGYEVFCHPKDALAVFDAVNAAGKPHGLVPAGLEALDMLRIEAGLIFAGYEFCDQTDPFEAGIGFAVPLKSKTEDFVGRAALIRRKEHPQRTLVGLNIDDNEVAAHGDGVFVGRAQVGVVTSGTRSPILKKTIALARLDVTHAALGTAVEIGKLDGRMKRLPARVARFPHYDPDKTRVRA